MQMETTKPLGKAARIMIGPADVVRLREPKGDCTFGIVASCDGDTVGLYPYDPSSAAIPVKENGAPTLIAVTTNDVEVVESRDSADRRKFERQAGCGILLLEVHAADPSASVPLVHAELIDVSQAGAAFLSHKEIAVGQEVQLGFLESSSREGLAVHAIVRNVAPADNCKWRIGCQFIGLPGEQINTFVC